MNNSITPLSGVQTLNAVQTTPTLQSVSFSVAPGLVETLKTVGTAFYVSACYFLDDAGNRVSTAAHAAMNSDSPFLVEAGTKVEFEHFERPFNELHFYALADRETFIEIQVAYMLRVSNSGGGAGTASDLAHLQALINETKDAQDVFMNEIEANQNAHVQDAENPHRTTLQQVFDAQQGVEVRVSGAKSIITKPVDGSFSGILLGDFAGRIVSVDATTGKMSGFSTETLVDPAGTSVSNRVFGAPLELAFGAKNPKDAVQKQQMDEAIASAVAAVYRFRGSVSMQEDLPGPDTSKVGDVWNVQHTGDNFAWTGTGWDKLSGEIDLSPYALKKDIENGGNVPFASPAEAGKVVLSASLDDPRESSVPTMKQLRGMRDSVAFPQVNLAAISDGLNPYRIESFSFPRNGLLLATVMAGSIYINRSGAEYMFFRNASSDAAVVTTIPVKQGDFVLLREGVNERASCIINFFQEENSSPITQAESTKIALEKAALSVNAISDTERKITFSGTFSQEMVEWISAASVEAKVSSVVRKENGETETFTGGGSRVAASTTQIFFTAVRPVGLDDEESTITLVHSGDERNVVLTLSGSLTNSTFKLKR